MVDITIKYKVIDLIPEEHSMVVRFFTDTITEDMLATEFMDDGKIVRRTDGSPTRCRTDYNINIFKTPTPSVEEIEAIIKSNAPAEWLHMQEQIKDPAVDTSLTDLQPLLNNTGTLVKPVNEPVYILPDANTPDPNMV